MAASSPESFNALGDHKDSFGTGKPLGSSILYNSEPRWDPSDGDFDRELREEGFHWTYTYSLFPPPERVLGATLTIVTLDIDDHSPGFDPDYYDVKLFLDGKEIPGAFDSLSDMHVGGDAYLPQVSVFTLGVEFLPSLQDGQLNVWIDPHAGYGGLDGLMIDYAELTIQTRPGRPVPEPSTLLLLGSGLAGLGGMAWRRHRTSRDSQDGR